MKHLLPLAVSLFVLAGSGLAAAESAAPVPGPNQISFGRALAAGANHVFVGAPADMNTPGRVFVYDRTDDGSWTDRSVLEAEKGRVGDGFGAAITASENTLVVGAPSSNAVVVFQADGDDWSQVARLTPSDSTRAFGTSLALVDNQLFVGSGATREVSNGDTTASGAVHLFRRSDDGSWTEAQVLRSEQVGPESAFGHAILASSDHLLVGAPKANRGAVVAFRQGPDGWEEIQTLTPSAESGQARFGWAMTWAGAEIVVGAPRAQGARGGASVYAYQSSDSKWTRTQRLQPEGEGKQFFGRALASDGSDLWVGAPQGISMLFLYQLRALQAWPGGAGAENQGGAVYEYERTENGWSQATRLTHPDVQSGDGLGAPLAAHEDVLAVGLPGDDYGAGTVGFYARADGKWSPSSPVAPTKGARLTEMTGDEQACKNGSAGPFACERVDLKSFLPNQAVGPRGSHMTDIWGWTDPKTGTEYAVVGRSDGTAFVDVSDPSAPVYVGELPLTDGAHSNTWRDVKVYENHALVVADNAGDHGMQVFDLTRLRDVDADARPVTFDEDAIYDQINSAHNLVVNPETGYAYSVGSSGGGKTCGGGLHMINIQDPENPSFAGCFTHRATGQSSPGYTHDAQCLLYDGPDTEYQGREICVGANETAISIADVTDKDSTVAISKASYPDYGYVHQGWFGENERYFYQNDEYDEIQGKVDRTRTLVWDLKDLDNPTLVNEILLSSPASDHNQYVEGSLMYEANYKSGLRILDLSDPAKPAELAHFDTKPYGPDSPGFAGAWSSYPYFESGIVVVTSIDEGFFVLEKPKKGL